MHHMLPVLIWPAASLQIKILYCLSILIKWKYNSFLQEQVLQSIFCAPGLTLRYVKLQIILWDLIIFSEYHLEVKRHSVKLGILSKSLRSFGPSNLTYSSSLSLEPWDTWQSGLWVPGGSLGGAHDWFFTFFSIFVVWVWSQCRPPSPCSGRSQPWPVLATPSESATEWSLGGRPLQCAGRENSSFLTHPSPPNLSSSGPRFLWTPCFACTGEKITQHGLIFWSFWSHL